MKERPILFSTEMVLAILEDKKTQTRRVIKPQPDELKMRWNGEFWEMCLGYPLGYDVPICPYGQPGDRLWVKETWGAVWPDMDPVPLRECKIEYRADLSISSKEYPGGWPADEARGNPDAPKWHSPRFMPRWASRIMLEITGIRAERLQDISGYDCIAEGIDPSGSPPAWGDWQTLVQLRYQDLWNQINDHRGYPWESNPWVWMIKFKRIQNT